MNAVIPTTTTLPASTTKILGDYSLLNTFLNSKAAIVLVLCAALIILAFIFKKEISDLIERIKNVNYKGKNKEFNLDIKDKKENEPLPIEAEASFTEDPDLKKEPKEKWEDPQTVEEWRMNMFISFWSNELDKAEVAYKKIQSLETDPRERKRDTIIYLQESYCYGGNRSDFDKLQKMKEDSEIVGDVCQAIGRCHEYGGNFSDAANEFIEASKVFKTDQERIDAKIYASKNILKTTNLEKAVEILSEELKSLFNEALEAKIYVGLAELYDSKNDQEMKTIILEKALKINPSDKDLLFKAGYSSSELPTNFYNLSLLHYKNSLKFGAQTETVFNNIGVQYERLDMPIKAVNSYKKSIEKGGTLAAANLSYRYLNAGFKEDAKKVLDETKDKKDIHKNVSEANTALLENIEVEDKKEKEFLEEAEKQQKFLAKFAEHYFVPCEIKNYSGEWKFDDGNKIIIEQTDSAIIGTWTIDGKKKFTGNIKNSAAKITNHRMIYSRSLTVPNKEIDYIEDGEGLIFIENKGSEIIRIMSIIGGKNKFSTLTRVV